MRIRTILASTAIAAVGLAALAGPAAADHTKGKKYLDLDLTREAAIAADDSFGVAPEGSSGEGAMYLNHGQERFCLFLDFELPQDVEIVGLHLHEKETGSQSGPVVIQASGLIADDGLSAQGCVTGDREFLRGVLSEPDDYYINAHTDDVTTDGLDLTVVRTEIGRN